MTTTSIVKDAPWPSQDVLNLLNELNIQVGEFKESLQTFKIEMQNIHAIHQTALDTLAEFVMGWQNWTVQSQNPELIERVRQQRKDMKAEFELMSTQSDLRIAQLERLREATRRRMDQTHRHIQETGQQIAQTGRQMAKTGRQMAQTQQQIAETDLKFEEARRLFDEVWSRHEAEKREPEGQVL